MEAKITEIIEEFLKNRRSISILNIIEMTGIPEKNVHEAIEALCSLNKVRIGGAGCSSSCLSCHGSCSEQNNRLSNETIIMPLVGRRSADEY